MENTTNDKTTIDSCREGCFFESSFGQKMMMSELTIKNIPALKIDKPIKLAIETNAHRNPTRKTKFLTKLPVPNSLPEITVNANNAKTQ